MLQFLIFYISYVFLSLSVYSNQSHLLVASVSVAEVWSLTPSVSMITEHTKYSCEVNCVSCCIISSFHRSW